MRVERKRPLGKPFKSVQAEKWLPSKELDIQLCTNLQTHSHTQRQLSRPSGDGLEDGYIRIFPACFCAKASYVS